MSFYSFIKRYTDLGVGTRDLGFRRPQTLPMSGHYVDANFIRRSLAPINQPGFLMVSKTVPLVPLTGTAGYAIPGQIVQQPLVKMDNSK